MRLTITSGQEISTIEVDKDLQLMDLKALIEIELQVPVSIQQLIHNGRHLQGDLASLISLGIQNDDMILVQSFQSEAETVRQKILNNPTLKTQFINQNPGLDRALQDPQGFERIYNEMQRQAKEQQTRQAQLYSADPFDIEAQRKIEEEIRKENIARNYETAIEHNPEFFGRVIMLYINVEINGVAVKAFVDSGAQASIMSPECAQNCNIMKFLDERFAGEARGVGTAKILGRIHSTSIKVGSQVLPISLSIMEGKDVDLLFGLDVLKRHQAIIDLSRNCLTLYGENVPFLNEHEFPEKAKEKPLLNAPLTDTTAPNPPPVQQQPETHNIVGPSSKYSDETIKILTNLGVSKEQAISALDASNGDPDMAANFLFQF